MTVNQTSRVMPMVGPVTDFPFSSVSGPIFLVYVDILSTFYQHSINILSTKKGTFIYGEQRKRQIRHKSRYLRH